ncbi:MAG: flagellar assembly protein FliW [Spirochaetaceae bacterium]|nr:flagellar assembly protein FliW [Spirochaetaceae bacterium]
MKVNTKAYGSIEVDDRQKISFPEGLFGFEALTEYVLLDGARQPYYWLQSVESAGAAFVVVDPFLFRPDYEMDINDDDLAEIGVSSPEDLLFFAVITIPQDGAPMTANLQGPLVINRKTRLGKQIILGDPRWKTKHDVLKELAESKKDVC